MKKWITMLCLLPAVTLAVSLDLGGPKLQIGGTLLSVGYVDPGPVIPDGLVGYWTFTNTNRSDSISNVTLELVGAVATTGVKGEADGAYYFDGTDDILRAPFAMQYFTTAGTWSYWVNSAQCSDDVGISFGIADGGSYSSWIMLNYGDRFAVARVTLGENASKYTPAAQPIVSNVWHHLVYATDGSTPSLYVDGTNFVIDGGGYGTIAKGLDDGNTNIWQWMGFGAYYFSTNTGQINGELKGSLDNVRIYNRKLASNEVFTIYSAEKP